MPDTSIMISAKDNYSVAINKMRDANKRFNTDLAGLQGKMEYLNNTRFKLQLDTDKASKALKEAKKEFSTMSDAQKDEYLPTLQKLNDEYEQSARNLKLTSQEARDAEKAMRNLDEQNSKAGSKASSGASGMGSAIQTLAATGLARMAQEAVSTLVSNAAGSYFGDDVSTVLSGVVSNAASGAIIGSVIPVVGTAVGAVIGASVGLISAGSELYAKQDDAFKEVVQDNYNTAKETQSNSLAAGTTIAGGREQTRISFSTLLGSEENADTYLSSMQAFAAKTPFTYDTLSSISKTLLAYGYKQEELLPLLAKVGEAGSALGMNDSDMTAVATALGRMNTTGKTTLEYLNPLLERGIPVFDYLAAASGKTNAEVQEMVSKGLIPGAEAAAAIADTMGYNFSGNMAKQALTYEGLLSTLEDAQAQLDNAMGEGYTEERKKGLTAQISYLEGETGQQMQEAYNQIGQWQASLENEKERINQDMLNSVMTGAIASSYSPEVTARLREMAAKYQEAASSGSADAGAVMGSLLAEAQVLASNEYMASDGYQLQIQSDLDLAARIGEDTSLKNEYWNTGYIMGQQFSKGRLAGIQSTGNNGLTAMAAGTMEGDIPEYATGLAYVPYDNYPALLHEGERVLTASEARSSGKVTASIIININGPVIREDQDVDAIAQIIAAKIVQAAEIAVN